MKKPLWKRIVKWTSLSILTLIVVLLLVVGVVIHFIFTPSKLTPVVEQMATEYLNAEIHFRNIELTFFSTFPDFGVRLEEATVISGVFRDTTLTIPPRASDSLMQVKSCLLTVNPVAYLLHNRIVVKDFVLEQPEIYACVDTTGRANWNVVRPDTAFVSVDTLPADTSDFQAAIRLKNVKIRNGKLVFDDRSTRLYTRLSGMNLDLDGFLGRRRSRLKLKFETEDLLFWQEGKLLVNHLQLGIETGMKVNRDSMLYTLEKAVFDVNGIRFGAGGTLKGDSVNRTVEVNLEYGVHIPTLKTLLDLIPDTILKKTDQVKVAGEVSCRGKVRGLYGRENIPLLTAEFRIREGAVAYPDMPSQIDRLEVDLSALIDLQKDQDSHLQLRHFCLQGGGMDIDLEGKAVRLLEDPHIEGKVDATVDFAALTRIFPLNDGITCAGKLSAALKGNVQLRDVQNADYGKLRLGGWCKMEGVEIFVPKDSIVLNVKSAGIVFASNRKNEKIVQGKDLLNGVVGYSGLDIHVQNKVRLLMDTTYLALQTSPLKDTSAVASVRSTLHLGRMLFIVRDTLLVGLKKADVKASLAPSKRDKKIPQIHAAMAVDSLRLRSMGNRLSLAKADLVLDAVRSRRNRKIWMPSGEIEFSGLRMYTPYFPIRMRMPGTRLRFDRNEIQLDSALLRLGRSDIRLTGSINNLARAFFKKEEIKAQLILNSNLINCNQLIRALDAGTAYRARVEAGWRDTISSEADDMEQLETVGDSLIYEGENALFVVPKGIDFTFQTDIRKVIFGKLQLDSIHGEVVMRNQCIQLSDLDLRSSAANMSTSAVYRATDTLRAYTGFSLQMHDIRIDSLVHLIPSLDTLFPMLRSFEGIVDFHMAADAWLDSTMMIELPTLRAAAYLDGRDLVLMDGETFAEISKMLMFKNKKRNLIDSISVDLAVKDGTVEIFPFLVEIDRYKAAVGGQHNIDMSFKYHISLLKSPLPFRAGMDISGTLDKMKFRITKAKYKDLFLPSRKARVDSTQLNLKKRIRELLHADSGH